MRPPVLGAKGLDSQSKVLITRIADLSINPRNARIHSSQQVREIARSIKRFGFNNPVLIDRRNQLIAGHGRVEAAKLLEYKTVPALRLDHMTEEEKRAYVIADNKLAEKAGWATKILAIEFQGLIDLDFDVELTGFEVPEIEMILDAASGTAAVRLLTRCFVTGRAGRCWKSAGGFCQKVYCLRQIAWIFFAGMGCVDVAQRNYFL